MIDKQKEVEFLADIFDLPAQKAAALVAESEDEAMRLAAERLEAERQHDPLAGDPVPQSPEEREVPDNAGLQKTVLHVPNERGRAGP